MAGVHSFFSDCAPELFRRIRRAAGIDEAEYAAGLCRGSLFERRASDGMSRCHFYSLDQPWLLIKQVAAPPGP